MRTANAAHQLPKADVVCGAGLPAPASAKATTIRLKGHDCPPLQHKALLAIGRYRHRVFAREVVRKALLHLSFDETLLRAAREAFPRGINVGDDAMLRRARKLLKTEPIFSAVRALLEAYL